MNWECNLSFWSLFRFQIAFTTIKSNSKDFLSTIILSYETLIDFKFKLVVGNYQSQVLNSTFTAVSVRHKLYGLTENIWCAIFRPLFGWLQHNICLKLNPHTGDPESLNMCGQQHGHKKPCIRETLNLLTNAGSIIFFFING